MELALVLLIQQPRVRFSVLPRIFTLDVAKIWARHCSEWFSSKSFASASDDLLPKKFGHSKGLFRSRVSVPSFLNEFKECFFRPLFRFPLNRNQDPELMADQKTAENVLKGFRNLCRCFRNERKHSKEWTRVKFITLVKHHCCVILSSMILTT